MKDIALWPIVGTTQHEQLIWPGSAGVQATDYELAAQNMLFYVLNGQPAWNADGGHHFSPLLEILQKAGTPNEWVIKAAWNACVQVVRKSCGGEFPPPYKPSDVQLIAITAQSDHFDLQVKVVFEDTTEIERTISIYT